MKMKFSCLIILGLLFVGCKSKKKDDDIVVPATELYANALVLLEKNKYNDAATEFGKVFLQHPGNLVTPQAELMHAYSLFLATEYEEAVDVLDTFIKLHPMNIDIAYAYYLKGLSYYMQISNVHLDQSRTSLAKASFDDVIQRFPGTKYAIDAALKIDLVNDHLAGKEMEIGRYYLRIKNPIAAILRFQNVIEQYQTTSHTSEALYRLVLGYKLLGLNEDAKKYAAVLGHNYPASTWYKHAYALVTKEE
ncbi:Outer membrane protein assembly factor BamD [Candidatus Trichorickettsia mobilis]|uniref:Outer membrane protein assembly factor BamD n=2 Tax=Candidatus Trichorickettsia mobilis TaxID=1346319 RepID=A0ABZ0UUU9_9RICK|nr:outer membrane protein assembly factor BamD [Candidatus Trichorickettsia mobilis]WPY00867.1 Outer membrane protein assembly factor BamD [Candidatus Trichorickettsia mobilis]